MWLSSTAQTALRALIHIASRGDATPVGAEQIARAIDAPRNYLSKTLHVLARAGVLESRRGRQGGFALAVPAAELRLDRIIAPFAPAHDRRCLLGGEGCGTTSRCVVHERWSVVAAEVERFLATTTVADLLQDRSPQAAPPPLVFLEEIDHAQSSR